MSSLREIKDRIGSVKSTLKITSAMKLVASSKLRKAQRAIETLRPYEDTLGQILAALSASGKGSVAAPAWPEEKKKKIAVVALSSNSSLCGGFNGNVIKKVQEVLGEYQDADVEVFSLGRKMAEAMRKCGLPSPEDYTDLIAHPAYDKSSALAETICAKFLEGEYLKVIIVYNHFVSTSKQVPVAETYLPFAVEETESEDETEYIVEPSAEEVLKILMPQVLMLKFYAAILDSAAAEHAARTVAMQTATDNADELLGELTLEYNKGRQQKITAEILDLIGGSAE